MSVKLCFFVKVLNASGRNVAGGKRMGKMAAFAGAVMLKGTGLNGRRGCTGVPNAGEDDGIDESGCCCAAKPLGAKNGGGLLFPFSGLGCSLGFCPFLRGLCTRIMLALLSLL